VIDAQTSYLVFEDRVKKHENYELIDSVNFKLLYHDLREKAIKEDERTKRKARSRFNEVLDRINIRNTSTWESVQKRIPTTADVQYLPLSDAERLDVFNEHMKRRAMEKDFDSTSEMEEGAVRKPKGKRRRSRSVSSSNSGDDSDRDRKEDRRNKRSRERDNDDGDDRDKKRARKEISKR